LVLFGSLGADLALRESATAVLRWHWYNAEECALLRRRDIMTDATPKPEIGVILEQLRQEVRARRMATNQAGASAVEQDLRRSLDEIELHRVVSAHWPLRGHTLPERVLVFVNKLVRRFLRWYINPIVEQQNAYNDAVARALHLLTDAYSELAEELREAGPTASTPHGSGSTPDAGRGTLPADRSAAALQAEVEQRAKQEPPARFIELELADQQIQLDQRKQVHAHWPIVGRTPIERATAFSQKLTRQYLRWLINPIVEQQNAANDAIAGVLETLTRRDAELRAVSAARRARVRR
jgi:hypothetical protein